MDGYEYTMQTCTCPVLIFHLIIIVHKLEFEHTHVRVQCVPVLEYIIWSLSAQTHQQAVASPVLSYLSRYGDE